MSATQLPTWAIYTLGFGSPVAAFLGAPIGNLFTRKAVHELERRSKREEAMRTLRWASELAAAPDQRRAEVGVAQLSVLMTADLLSAEEKVFVVAALETALGRPPEAVVANRGNVRVVTPSKISRGKGLSGERPRVDSEPDGSEGRRP